MSYFAFPSMNYTLSWSTQEIHTTERTTEKSKTDKNIAARDCPYRTEPMTNADRIRSMSDEELAHWLEYEGGGACAEMCGWLNWLQQPPKGE